MKPEIYVHSIGSPDVRLSFYTPNYILPLRDLGLLSRLEFWFRAAKPETKWSATAKKALLVLLGAEFFPHEIKKKTNGHPSLSVPHFFQVDGIELE